MIWWPTEIPTLRDAHITLRPPREEDIQQIFLACQDPVIPRFTTVPSPYTISHAQDFIRVLAPKQFSAKEEILFIITSDQISDDEFCGVISFHTVNLSNHRAELGYWIANEARRRNIGATSVKMLSRYGLETIGFRRIEAYVDVDNLASRKLLSSAAYQLEGRLSKKVTRPNGEQIDMALYAQVQD